MELADRLPFCPRCSYPFIGLPDAHQCPECGLPYDAESRMWTAVASRWGMRRTLNLSGGIIAIAIGITQLGAVALPQSNLGRVQHGALGVAALVAAPFLLRAWKLDRGPQSRFVAAMPDGFWHVDSLMVHRNVPWIQIRSVELQSPYVDIALVIHLTSQGKVVIPREFVSYADAKDAVSQMKARMEKSTA